MAHVEGREQQIAEIEAALKTPLLPEIARKLLERQLQDLLADQDHTSMQGTVNVSDDGRINGVAVGFNLGRIIFGRDPAEEERRQLVWYLTRLATKLYRLPLRGLDEQLEQGKGIGLPQVYVMLATSRSAASDIEAAEKIRSYFDTERSVPKKEQDPDWALPSDTIAGLAVWDRSQKKVDHILESEELRAFLKKEKRLSKQQGWVVIRPQSLIQAVRNYRRLVLLGDPGSGKSTFLRHFAWILAQRGLDQLKDVSKSNGRDDEHLRLPIILPLRTLAGKLAQQGESNTENVVASVQGMVNVSGQGKIYGPTSGVNTGTMMGGTYCINDKDDKDTTVNTSNL